MTKQRLWAEAVKFARAAGHCGRSDAWHEEEVCVTCQEFVNFARRILQLAIPEGPDPQALIASLRAWIEREALIKGGPVTHLQDRDALVAFGVRVAEQAVQEAADALAQSLPREAKLEADKAAMFNRPQERPRPVIRETT